MCISRLPNQAQEPTHKQLTAQPPNRQVTMYNMEFVALRVLGSGPGPSGSPAEAVVDFEIDIKQKLVGRGRCLEGVGAGVTAADWLGTQTTSVAWDRVLSRAFPGAGGCCVITAALMYHDARGLATSDVGTALALRATRLPDSVGIWHTPLAKPHDSCFPHRSVPLLLPPALHRPLHDISPADTLLVQPPWPRDHAP